MSLPIPNLDDMTFDDLMKEAKALIPIYDKEWTNYNPSDPGITLLELFSYLCELVIYRINQIPEVNYGKFLKLLAVDNQTIGSGTISRIGKDVIGDHTLFDKELKEGDLITVCGQTRKITAVNSNFCLTIDPGFDTRLPIVDGFSYLSARELKTGSGKISSNGKDVVGGHTLFDKELKEGYLITAFGQIRKITAINSNSILTVYPAFDTCLPAGVKFSYFSASGLKIGSGKISSNGKDVTGDHTLFKEELRSGDFIKAFGQIRKITAVSSNSILTVEPAFDIHLPAGTDFSYLPASELKTGSGKISSNGRDVIGDHTLFGKELKKGDLIKAFGQTRKIIDIHSNSVLTIHPAFDTHLPAETDFSYLPASELKTGSGKISSNGKDVTGEHTLFDKELKKGDLITAFGQIRKVAAIDSNLNLTVDSAFDAHLPAGTKFSYLSAGSGTISGKGKVLTGDGTVFTSELKIGDSITLIGSTGTADQTRRIMTINSDTSLTIDSVFDQELLPGTNYYHSHKSIDSGICEGLEALSRRYRAITTEDYEHLAIECMETLQKGLAGRVICVNNRDLEQRREENSLQPGHVSLIIIPRCRENPVYCENDLPKDELLKKIKDYLDARKLVTTRLRVVGPDYKKVKLEVWISLKENALNENVRNKAVEKIKRYFDPIKGGQDGKGWPLGRDVYRSEIFKLLEGIKGVDHGVKVKIKDSDENLKIGKYQLILLDPDPIVNIQ